MLRSLPHSLHAQYTLFPKKLRLLFVAHLIRYVADQAISMFIPLFLYTRSSELAVFNSTWLHGLTELQAGIALIATFYFTSHFAELVLLIPLTKLMKRLGLIKSMALGNILSVVFYLSLFASQFSPWALVVAAVLDGIITAVYWISYYTEFAVHADMSKMGSEVGSMLFLEQLLRAAMPMLGGALIMAFGFGSSYLTAAILFMVASVILMFMPEVKFSYEVTFKEFRAWCSKKSFIPTLVGFAGKYVDEAAFFIWPVFIFLFLGSVQRVGYIYSIVLFVSLIVSYFMGWYLGKHKSSKLFMLSGVILSGMWVLRGFIGQVWHLLIIDTADRLALCVYTPIFETYFLRKSLGKKVFHFHVYRAMINSFTALVFWPVVVSLFMLPFAWTGLFGLATIGILLSMSMKGGQVEH